MDIWTLNRSAYLCFWSPKDYRQILGLSIWEIYLQLHVIFIMNIYLLTLPLHSRLYPVPPTFFFLLVQVFRGVTMTSKTSYNGLMLQSYWLCMSLLKTLKDSDCAYYVFIFHNYFVLTMPSMWNLLCMRVSTTWQLWLLDCIHLSQNVWCYTGDTCVSVLCECVYDWLSMLVQLYMLCGRGLQHRICALPNPFSCKWNKICLNEVRILFCLNLINLWLRCDYIQEAIKLAAR